MVLQLVIDFDIPKDLADIYAESSTCTYVGNKDGELSVAEAQLKLEQYAATKTYGAFERLGIMKIYVDAVLVGFSMPRVIKVKEHKVFMLEEEEVWYRIGTVYIAKAFRGQGIMRDTIREFKKIYPNLLWTCNEKNRASMYSAAAGGLVHSHNIYVGEDKYWEHQPFEGMIRTDLVFKSKLSNQHSTESKHATINS